MAVISNRHATRLLFQRLSKPSAEYEREDYQTPALLEVRILADSVSGCRYRWLALPPRSRAVCRIGGRIAGHGLSSPAVALAV
jgi:hypothetical protein